MVSDQFIKSMNKKPYKYYYNVELTDIDDFVFPYDPNKIDYTLNKNKMNRIIQGDSRTELAKLPDESVNCCVTSPPYYGLRDYGTATWEGGEAECDHRTRENKRDETSTLKGKSNAQGYAMDSYVSNCGKCGAVRIDSQIGLEETPEEYVNNLVEVFREVKRVLKKDGTLWLNLGDSYASGGGGYTSQKADVLDYQKNTRRAFTPANCKPKDLIGIPWLVAFALRSDGWYLRQDIIWHKPNPMPESVTDRCTKSHEYIFLLSKSNKYYFDNQAIGTKILDDTIERYKRGWNGNGDRAYPGGVQNHIKNFMESDNEKRDWANKKSVWTVNTYPYSEAHFATFPEDLIVDCIKAGCPEGGIVLDPFSGAGTTALVARKLNRNYLGIELNPEYIKITEKRLRNELGMFL